MILAIIVVAVYAIAILLDLVPNRKSWDFRMGAVYVVILAVGFLGLFLHSMHAKVPSPTDAIIAVVKAVFPNIG
jgi:hypothetical protein